MQNIYKLINNYHRGFGSPFNQRDEEKFHVSPRSSTRSGRTPSTPQMSHAQERKETPASSVTKVPLTRRKWLESSVPGLIFGSGGEGVAIDQPTTDENPPMRTQASVTVTPCELTQQYMSVMYIICLIKSIYSWSYV